MTKITNRGLWSVFMFIAAVLQGCVMTQPPALYSQWQQRAYSAYSMTPPANTVLLMNTVLPPRFLGEPHAAVAAMHPVATPLSKQEERFISQYYSLR